MSTSLSGAQAILAYLNKLTAEQQTGEVLIRSRALSAKVYLDQGLIVWAFAAGQRETFQTILISENKLSREAVLEGIQEARKNGKKSLDEILVALGVAEENARVKIITAHTKSAVRTICSWTTAEAEFVAYKKVAPSGVRGLTLAALLAQNSKSPSGAQKEVAPAGVPHAAVQQNFDSLEDVLRAVRQETPQFTAAALIEQRTAAPVAFISDQPALDLDSISAFFRDVHKSAADALSAIDSGQAAQCREVLINSDKQCILLQPLLSGSYLLCLLLAEEANPAKARIAVRRHLDALVRFLQ